ncbi:hypothetical protein [Allonocardiopsis opalescens]|uniref:hypothetical protein n=1 Tax=Allonocardiopsis opalescens TaxID=1144618 RepID=UPI000D049697|nr:hypothetical protein [Allonocardiopsis opalescens]
MSVAGAVSAAGALVELAEALRLRGIDHELRAEGLTLRVWRGVCEERVALRPNLADGGRLWWCVWWAPAPDADPGDVGDLDPVVPVDEVGEFARRVDRVLEPAVSARS